MEDSSNKILELVLRDGRYAPAAFEFLHHALERAAAKVHPDDSAQPRHVTGPQLCEALRELALERWGPLARDVLARWEIRSTRDFGEMVFLMISIGVMGRQESDSLSDFDNVYDFASAFARYEISLRPLEYMPCDRDHRTRSGERNT